MFLAISNSGVNELCVLGLLGSREDQRRVCRGILGLVFANGYGHLSVDCMHRNTQSAEIHTGKVTRIAHHDLPTANQHIIGHV